MPLYCCAHKTKQSQAFNYKGALAFILFHTDPSKVIVAM